MILEIKFLIETGRCRDWGLSKADWSWSVPDCAIEPYNLVFELTKLKSQCSVFYRYIFLFSKTIVLFTQLLFQISWSECQILQQGLKII